MRHANADGVMIDETRDTQTENSTVYVAARTHSTELFIKVTALLNNYCNQGAHARAVSGD